jgi:hypothetical protein
LSRRARIATTIDRLAIVLFVTALGTAWTGGFYLEIGDGRVSMRDPDRALLLAGLLIALRWWRARDVPPLGIEFARWRRWWVSFYQPTMDDVVQPSAAGRQRLVYTAVALVGILAFTAVLLRPQIARMDSVTDYGDPLFSIWRLGWVYQQLLGDPRPLFGGNIFYPEPLVLTYSDSMLLPGLLQAPLRAMGLHPVIASNVLFVSAFVLSALATYLLVERLTGSPRAAFISALIYGFYPYRFEHYAHFELQMTFWMPLALIWLHDFCRTLRIRSAIIAALLVVAQLYSSMYYAVFFSLYAAAVVGTLFVLARAPWRRLVTPVAAVLALAIGLSIPLARPYLAAHAIKGDRGEAAVRFYSATPLDYLRPHARSATYGGRLLDDTYPERALFPGTLPIALSIVGMLPPVGATRLAYAIGLVAAFDMSLGYRGLTYKHLYRWFLPIRSMRVPARMSIVLAISLAVLSAYGVRRILTRIRTPGAQTLVFGALIGAAAIDFMPTLELIPVWRSPPPIYEAVRSTPGVVLAEFPPVDSLATVTASVPFMYFSVWHWLPMVNGYSGYRTEAYADFAKSLEDFPSSKSLDALRARGATHITVTCALYKSGCDQLLTAVDASGAFRLLVSAQWEGQPTRLYEWAK